MNTSSGTDNSCGGQSVVVDKNRDGAPVAHEREDAMVNIIGKFAAKGFEVEMDEASDDNDIFLNIFQPGQRSQKCFVIDFQSADSEVVRFDVVHNTVALPYIALEERSGDISTLDALLEEADKIKSTKPDLDDPVNADRIYKLETTEDLGFFGAKAVLQKFQALGFRVVLTGFIGGDAETTPDYGGEKLTISNNDGNPLFDIICNRTFNRPQYTYAKVTNVYDESLNGIKGWEVFALGSSQLVNSKALAQMVIDVSSAINRSEISKTFA